MSDVFVGSLMSAPVRTVGRDASLRRAARTMTEHGDGSIVVVDDRGHLEGILTSTDFVRLVATEGASADSAVADYMSTAVVTTTAAETIEEVARTMLSEGIHHVPVVDETEGVVGIITTTDLAAYLSYGRPPPEA